jgi:hypothetical protein
LSHHAKAQSGKAEKEITQQAVGDFPLREFFSISLFFVP